MFQKTAAKTSIMRRVCLWNRDMTVSVAMVTEAIIAIWIWFVLYFLHFNCKNTKNMLQFFKLEIASFSKICKLSLSIFRLYKNLSNTIIVVTTTLIMKM